jgi:hypothetical protein
METVVERNFNYNDTYINNSVFTKKDLKNLYKLMDMGSSNVCFIMVDMICEYLDEYIEHVYERNYNIYEFLQGKKESIEEGLETDEPVEGDFDYNDEYNAVKKIIKKVQSMDVDFMNRLLSALWDFHQKGVIETGKEAMIDEWDTCPFLEKTIKNLGGKVWWDF